MEARVNTIVDGDAASLIGRRDNQSSRTRACDKGRACVAGVRGAGGRLGGGALASAGLATGAWDVKCGPPNDKKDGGEIVWAKRMEGRGKSRQWSATQDEKAGG